VDPVRDRSIVRDGAMTPVVIEWVDPDPRALISRLGRAGLRPSASGSIDLSSATLQIVKGGDRAGSDRAGGLRAPNLTELPGPDVLERSGAWPERTPSLVAIGWATVDLERATGALPGMAFVPAADDPLLGARVWVCADRVPAASLLEPTTEGRLAATLVRYGEGPAVLYVSIPRGSRSATQADGPFGSSSLIRGGPAWGPHVVVVAAFSGRSPR
jgi:hypothetical protein